MVHLTGAENEFAARVMVAKLGSAGILAEVRGVSGPYPNLGSAQVYVEEAEYGDACELIDADLEDPFAGYGDELTAGVTAAGAGWGESQGGQGHGPGDAVVRRTGHPGLRPVLLATSLLLVSSFALPHCGPAPTVRSH